MLLCIFSVVVHVAGCAAWLRRGGVTISAAALLILPWLLGLQSYAFFYQPFVPNEMAAAPAPLDFPAEKTMYRQTRMLERAIGQLAPERPGKTDLYWLAFAGDGNEAVFHNEVLYFRELMDKRQILSR